MNKFKRGDLVHIAADLGQHKSHFRAGCDAFIDGVSGDDYAVVYADDGHWVAWYQEHELTLVKASAHEEMAACIAAREVRDKQESDLTWIVANWQRIRTHVPGATMGELMRRVGITNPWGSQGEGMAYYANARKTFAALDPVLCTGDMAQVEHVLSELRLPTTDVRIG